MLNSVSFIGRLTADPELRTTPNGASVTTFTIAVERPFQKSGQDKQTDFFDLVAWRGTAETITRYFHKGNLICVQGYMTTRTYTDKNGINRKVYELVTEHVHFVESKKATENPADITPPPSPPQADNDGFTELASDDDLPF